MSSERGYSDDEFLAQVRGVLNEQDVTEALREVRMALLEADVNFKVVKEFVDAVKERAVGSGVLESLTPGQQVVKIVYEELVRMMGETATRIQLVPMCRRQAGTALPGRIGMWSLRPA